MRGAVVAYSSDAFNAANQPGRGSAVGDFVPGKNGGWVPKNHPDAMPDASAGGIPAGGAGSPTRVDGGPDYAADAGGGGSVGASPGEAGPSGPAISGLGRASAMSSGSSASGVQEMAPPSASNPQLGQRIYPTAMRQLSLLPRAY